MKTHALNIESPMDRRSFLIRAGLGACAWTALGSASHAAGPSLADRTAARGAIRYLRRVMDEYHSRFPVYLDESSGGNHFNAFAKIPDGNARVSMDAAWVFQPKDGATCIRCNFEPGGVNFGGFYFLNGILPAGAAKEIGWP